MNRSPEFVDLLLSGNEAEALRFSETIAAQEVYSGTKRRRLRAGCGAMSPITPPWVSG